MTATITTPLPRPAKPRRGMITGMTMTTTMATGMITIMTTGMIMSTGMGMGMVSGMVMGMAITTTGRRGMMRLLPSASG